MSSFSGKLVVVPWDFSEYSVSSLQYALDLIPDPGLIRVVHVMQIPTAAEPGVLWEMVTEESMQQHSEAAFRRMGERVPAFAGLEFVSLFGDPGAALADYADTNDAGLIVISSHGRTGIGRWLLGSVAERVVRLATCPVLVLKPDHSE